MDEADLAKAADGIAISIATGPIIRYQHYMKLMLVLLGLTAFALAELKTVEWMNDATAVMEHPLER